MPIYRYQGRARDGKKIQGEMEGANIHAVAQQLKSIQIIPLEIKEKQQLKASQWANLQVSFGNPSRLSPQDLIFFSRQVYTLLKASVPIMQALEGLQTTASNEALADVIRSLREGLDEGLDLTSALRRQTDIFPELFISMVHIGEITGKLPEVFLALSIYIQKEKETRDQVKAALRYPMIVIAVIIIGLVIVNMFVIPNFAEMFANFNAELPLPTRILMATSDFMIAYWPVCLALPVATAFLFLKFINTEYGKRLWHEKMLKLPLFGKLIMQSAITRFARSLSITGRAGVPMEQALRVIAPSVGNIYFEEKINEMREGVERGESITRNARRMNIFPNMVLQMISVGEESGTLDTMIAEVADYYERELEYTIKSLTAAIEPIMVFFIAGIVLVMALGIFLPMISLLGAIG